MSLESLKRNGHNLHLGDFPLAGEYGIPQLEPVYALDIENVRSWLPFNNALANSNRAGKGVHFYLDDYLFERVWKDPVRYMELLSQYEAVMSPDFSLFTDYPRAVQIYNHWKKHQLAAAWQAAGMTVVPSICWSDEKSFRWCFDGEPVGGVVSVSSVGTQKDKKSRFLFKMGYNEMLARLRPEKIIFFGAVPAGCGGNIARQNSFYSGLAHAQKKKPAEDSGDSREAIMISCTLNGKKYTVDYVTGRALRELEPAAKMYGRIVAVSDQALKGHLADDAKDLSIAEAVDVMVKWFCVLFNNQFTPDEVLDYYPADRLMHDVALAIMAVETQTTEVLDEFPTKAAVTEEKTETPA